MFIQARTIGGKVIGAKVCKSTRVTTSPTEPKEDSRVNKSAQNAGYMARLTFQEWSCNQGWPNFRY